MGGINWLAVVLGAVAFFAVGAIWYSFLFSKTWQAEVNLTDEQKASFNMPLTFGLCFLAELVIAATVGHMFDYLEPDDKSKLMIAIASRNEIIGCGTAPGELISLARGSRTPAPAPNRRSQAPDRCVRP